MTAVLQFEATPRLVRFAAEPPLAEPGDALASLVKPMLPEPLSEQAIRQRSTSARSGRGLKRACDVAGSGAAVFALFPLLVIIALLVRATSRGPMLFRQQRYGLDGQRFEIFKFRTMHQSAGDPLGVMQTKSGDVRVTGLGRVLRRYNLDELPQLLNVLRGDMSLVGPRPHVPGMLAGGRPYEHLVPYYFVRNHVRPGLTGLAQVNGLRGPTDDEELAVARVNHDLAYIAQWSILLDAWILWTTATCEHVRKGGV